MRGMRGLAAVVLALSLGGTARYMTKVQEMPLSVYDITEGYVFEYSRFLPHMVYSEIGDYNGDGRPDLLVVMYDINNDGKADVVAAFELIAWSQTGEVMQKQTASIVYVDLTSDRVFDIQLIDDDRNTTLELKIQINKAPDEAKYLPIA